MKIYTKKIQTLFIDLDDTLITVSKAGLFNGKQQFLWTSISPTEGLDCDYESVLIGRTSLISRIDLISDSIGTKLVTIDKTAIDLFFTS